jgi:hypothetical protein
MLPNLRPFDKVYPELSPPGSTLRPDSQKIAGSADQKPTKSKIFLSLLPQ